VNWRQHSQQKTGKSPGKKTPWSPFREYFENNILCKETKITKTLENDRTQIEAKFKSTKILKCNDYVWNRATFSANRKNPAMISHATNATGKIGEAHFAVYTHGKVAQRSTKDQVTWLQLRPCLVPYLCGVNGKGQKLLKTMKYFKSS